MTTNHRLEQYHQHVHEGCHINKAVIDKLSVIGVEACRMSDYVRTDKVLLGVLLSMRHQSMSGGSKKAVGTYGLATRYSTGGTGGTRQRLMSSNISANYDRILTFGDLSTPGICFALIFKQNGEFREFLSNCGNVNVSIGDMFMLMEPMPISRSMGTSQHYGGGIYVVEITSPCFPLQHVAPNFTGVPFRTELVAPERGCTRYFSMHNVKELTIETAQFVSSTFSGMMCDRQTDLRDG